MSRRRAAVVGLLAPLLLAPAGAALAQGAGVLTATISQSVEADSNYRLDQDSPGTSYFGDTRLGLDLLRDTATQQFELGFDTGLRALWEAEQDFDLTFASPSTARAGYRQEWAGASVDADLRYRQREVDFLDEIDFGDGVIGLPPDALDQAPRDTIEQRYDAGISLDLATDAPSSYRLDLQATRFDYREDDNELSPRTEAEGEALWRLRLNPVLSGALLGSYNYFESEDDAETLIREAEVDVGVIYEPDENLSANFGIGWATRERRETTDGERETTEDESGPAFRAGVSYDVVDEFILAANAQVTTAAPETRLTGQLRASYQLPRGRIAARLSQDFTGDTEGNEVRVTTARLGLTRDINSVSSIGIDFAYGLQVDQDVEGASDVSRADVSAIYSRSITDNVFANLGYRFRWRDEDGTATSNAVFVTLGRSFTSSF